MNTKNLIDQLNTLIDQAPAYVVDGAFSKAANRLNGFTGFENEIITKGEATEAITDLIQELAPARVKVKHKNFTGKQLEAAMFNITREIARVDEYTNNQDVIDYAERLAREIMYATKNTAPDTCEH